MPVLVGFILGVIVTVVGAYAYDSQTGRTANGLSAVSAGGEAPVVNWAVVGDEWTRLETNVRLKTEDLERSLRRHIG